MEQTLIKCEDCIYFKSSSYHDKMWCRDCQQHNKFKPKNMKYTEGIAFDGTAILEDGNPITITEILSRLNDSEQLQAKHKEEIKQAVIDAYTEGRDKCLFYEPNEGRHDRAIEYYQTNHVTPVKD